MFYIKINEPNLFRNQTGIALDIGFTAEVAAQMNE